MIFKGYGIILFISLRFLSDKFIENSFSLSGSYYYFWFIWGLFFIYFLNTFWFLFWLKFIFILFCIWAFNPDLDKSLSFVNEVS